MNGNLTVFIEQGDECHGKVMCPGGTALLVGHHVDFVFRVAQHEHGLYEVLAYGGVEPCRAHNHVVAATLTNEAFAFCLCAAIHRLWVDGIIDFVRLVGIAAEDIVGGDVDKQGIAFQACISQHFGRKGVNQGGQLRLVFGFVDGGVGGAVDAGI